MGNDWFLFLNLLFLKKPYFWYENLVAGFIMKCQQTLLTLFEEINYLKCKNKVNKVVS